MAQGANDRKHWSREDMERYLNGQMPDAERHALERAALDDPFLADAIEGLQQRTSSERSVDFETLSKKLAERTDDKVRRIGAPSKWWWAAAASLLLIGGSVFWLRTQVDRTFQDVAKALPHDHNFEQDSMSPTGQEETAVADMNSKADSGRGLHVVTEPKISSAEQRTQPPVASAPTVSTTQADDLVAARTEAPPVAKAKAVITPQESERPASLEQIMVDPHITNIFRGRVIDEKGQGIPFANIQMVGGGAPTYANAKGDFKVMSMDSSITLVTHVAGYKDVKSDLRSGQPLALVLMQPTGSALSEVVVTGNHAKKKKAQASIAKQKPVRAETDDDEVLEDEESEPVDGWAKYELYLNNNNRLNHAEPWDVTPEVEILFLVSANGTPYDMKVERSSSPKYEAEALRLLRDGPKWQAAKPGKKPLKGYITLQF